MSRNIEIKAKVRDVAKLLTKTKILSRTPEEVILQHDTFYDVKKGRLKLRKYEDGSADLIYYERENIGGPKLSKFQKAFVPSSAATNIDSVLKKALGEKGIVSKKRQLFMIGQTRVHIDTVAGLGNFMELEIELKANQTVDDVEEIAFELMDRLGIEKSDLVSGAYRDLLQEKQDKEE